MDINALLASASNTQHTFAYFIGLAFIAGLLVSLTPCIYPMIPITIGILHTNQQQSLWKNFFAALLYVSGISIVYAALGFISATTSVMFGSWLGNTWFIIFLLFFFTYLAGSMFGWYELHIPSFAGLSTTQSGPRSLPQIFLFGMISGTITSPCLTPALAILLSLVAKQANPLLGFITLFSFAFGMGSLLIIIGTGAGALSLLPRAGEWMNIIKNIFGFITLATGIYLAQPLLGTASVLCYWFIACTATVFYAIKIRTNSLAIILMLIAATIAVYLAGPSFVFIQKVLQ